MAPPTASDGGAQDDGALGPVSLVFSILLYLLKT